MRMDMIKKKKDNHKCWWGWGVVGTLVHCYWGCKMIETLENVYQFLKVFNLKVSHEKCKHISTQNVLHEFHKSIIYQSSKVEVNQEFPDSLVTRIWCFHHLCGLGSIPSQGTETLQAACLGQKKKNVESSQMHINWWIDE